MSALVRKSLGATMETLRFSTALCPTYAHFRHDHGTGEPRGVNSPEAIAIFSSRWRDHGDDDGDDFLSKCVVR